MLLIFYVSALWASLSSCILTYRRSSSWPIPEPFFRKTPFITQHQNRYMFCKDVHPWPAAIPLEQSFLTRLGYCRRISKRFIRHKIELCNFHWFIMKRSLTKVHDVMMITEDEFSYTGNKSFANFKHGKMAISSCCNGIGMITCLLSCWKDKILLVSFH